MGEKPGWFRNYSQGSAVLIFSLSLFPALFFFRSFDDNRSTSWADVFTVADPAVVFSFLIIGIFAALAVSRLSWAGRYSSFFLFGFSFAFAAVFWSEPEINIDASRYFSQAKHLELYGAGFFFREWGRAISAWTDLPVVPFFYGVIFSVFGENRVYIQLFTTLLFSLSVLLTSQIGKKLWNADTGFYAGMLLLGIPYLYSQVPLMLVDVPAMFLLLLAIFTFLTAVEKGNALRILLSSLSIMLAFYSKYSMWLMLSVVIVFAVIYRGSVPGLKTSIYLTRTFAIFITALFLIGAVFIYKFDFLSEQFSLLLSYQKPGLRRWGESFLSTFFFQIHPLITLAALYSVFAAWRKKDLRYLGAIWLLLVVFFFQIRRIRYIIMVFPMLTLMASYGLQQIRQKEIIKFISLSIVVFSLVLSISAYLPFLRQNSASNLAKAGNYLDDLGATAAVVITVPSKTSVVNPAVSVPILDLYTRADLSYVYEEKTARGENEISESPLRFTWEYINPYYYRMREGADKGASFVAIIADGVPGELPEEIKESLSGYDTSVSFNTTDSIYEYQPVITIYYRKNR